ncbi:MAG TPA: protoporphyrinogen oxidase [Microlunatus sp.]|nr:protoporphyrinogen oxidase [Microlunatus sp.]
MTRHVAVIGGGVAGLVAARRLRNHFGHRVTVFEGSSRFGGKLAPVVLEGVRLDGGAESFLARRPEAVDLVHELGFGVMVVHPTAQKPRLLIGGRPIRVPPSLLGVPTDLSALAGALTDNGYARAAEEPRRSWPPLADDVAIGSVVDDHFGPEVTDRVLEPMLGGVYAGRSRELSFAAVAPGLFQRAKAGGSLLSHAQHAARSEDDGPVFGGLAGGVSRLADALVHDLRRRRVTLRSETTVRSLSRSTAGGWELLAGSAAAPEIVPVDAVVLATPARAFGRLLAPTVPSAAAWAEMPYASVAVITLVLRDARLDGSGLLVPPGGLPTIKAITHSSVKWAWVAEAALERWGRGVSVVRASVGRVGEEELLQVPDEALIQRTFAEAQQLPGWTRSHLITGHVSRWGGGLPQYLVGHRERVERLQAALASEGGLAVCGAALNGVGIAACVASATAAADKIDQDLSGPGEEPTDP